MAPRTPIRAAAFAGLVSCLLVCAPGWAPAPGAAAADRAAEAPTQIVIAASDSGSRSLALGIGKSVVIDFPRDIKDVLVGDPKTANAVIRSLRRAYIIANAAGATNIVFFDADGKQMADFEITVDPIKTPPSRVVITIENAIHKYVPGADDVKVESVGDGIILSGTVANQLQAQQAYDIASHFVDPCAALSNNDSGSSGSSSGGSSGSSSSVSISTNCAASGFGSSGSGGGVKGTLNGVSSSKIVNLIVVRGRDQVMLKVTVAEVERDLIKQLGINLAGSLGYGTAVVNFNNTNPFTAYGQSLSGSSITAGWKNISATLQAMEQAGVIHTLAEPSLTAISGEKATFYAGGQFPVLTGYTCSIATPGSTAQSCQPAIQFKNFGVALNFIPIVLSEGRISLNVTTDVSDLSTENSITITAPGTTNTATVPSIKERSASSTVEIPSGGSLAMAGMIQNETKHQVNGFPGLMELPVLGPLFKSNDYVNQQTELMVLVTPYVVRAVAQKDLSRPDDGFADPSDPAQMLLGRFNRIYGVGGVTDPPDNYRGKYGFILD